jgi:hypothetical protein
MQRLWGFHIGLWVGLMVSTLYFLGQIQGLKVEDQVLRDRMELSNSLRAQLFAGAEGAAHVQ